MTGPAPRSPAAGFLLDPAGWLRHAAAHVAAIVTSHALPVASAAGGAVVVLVLGRTFLGRWRHARYARDARLLAILPPPQAALADAVVFWTQMLGLLRPVWARVTAGQPHLAWEYVFTAAGARIRLWVPGTVPPGLAERAVEAAWPGARAVPAADVRPAGGQVSCGGLLRLARPDHYPLASGFTADPLRGLFGAAASPGGDEQVIVQVLARPVTGRRLRHAHRAAAMLRGTARVTVRGRFFDLLTPSHARASAQRSRTSGQMRPETAAEMRAIVGKAALPRLECAVRYAVTTAGADVVARARRRGRAAAVAAAFAIYIGANHLVRRRLRRAGPVIASRRFGHGDLLSAQELAALAHLPEDLAVPGLARAPARPVAPPPQVPSGGPGCKILGDSDAGAPRPVALTVADARFHTHVLGQTGTGKTTWLLSMALADAAAGRGFVFLESKGDSARLLSRLPETAAGKVLLLDPDDPGPHPCLNILDSPDPALTADTVCGIFARLWPEYWGPRSDDMLRSALLTLASLPGATLADVPLLLTDDAWRAGITAGIGIPELRGFWDWYQNLSEAGRGAVTAPVMNKLRAVLLRGFARDVLAGGRSSVNLAAHLNDGGIVIARLAKGALGEDATRLLSSLLLAKTWEAILSRASVPERQRPDITVYVDECHNALAAARGLDDMLAEARGYRAALVLAHQNLAQLPRDLREALSANARNKVFFDISPEDARTVTRHFTPSLGEHDLAHLDAYQAAVRLVAGGALTPAFTLRTRPLPQPARGRETIIRRASRAAYGRPSGSTAPFRAGHVPAGDPRITRDTR